ncbi:LIM domain-containing protein PLIM2c [Spatholobus suberectus]|nr:LIM domain-containing protein PLIM2c [Spatholobus suberectus]
MLGDFLGKTGLTFTSGARTRWAGYTTCRAGWVLTWTRWAGSLDRRAGLLSCWTDKTFGCPLPYSSYAAVNGVFYYRAHFAQLFMEQVNYNHVFQVVADKRTSSFTPLEPDVVSGCDGFSSSSGSGGVEEPVLLCEAAWSTWL